MSIRTLLYYILKLKLHYIQSVRIFHNWRLNILYFFFYVVFPRYLKISRELIVNMIFDYFLNNRHLKNYLRNLVINND
jgi:hypothetical protein